jgi:hypothetical protein
VPDRRAPPVGASLSAHSPSLSLPRGPELSVPSSRTRARFSLCPAVPTCQPSSTFRPRSPRHGRTHDRAFSGHIRAPAPLLSPCPARPPLLSHLRPLPNSLALSLALPRRTGSSTTARRRPLPVPWPPLRPCPVQRHGELRLTVSCSGHPLVCPFLPCCVWSMLTGAVFAQPEPRRRRPEAPPHLRRPPRAPKFTLKVSNPPVPLIWSSLLCCLRDCSPEQSSAAVSSPCQGLRPLVPLRQLEGHG